MKALGVFCAVVIVALALFSGLRIAVSVRSTDVEASAGEQSAEHAPWRVQVYRDPETGCEYVANYSGAMTPRLEADGRPMCGGEGER